MSGTEPPVEPVDEEVDATNEEVVDGQGSDELALKVADLEDRLLRARADYDNLQKRHLRDAELERERAKARVVEPFLHVGEYVRMATKEAEKTNGGLADGVKMLAVEFERALADLGVARIGEVGDAFDPSVHEATGELAVDGVEAGAVSSIIAPGYRLGERVLRYAKVMTQPRG